MHRALRIQARIFADAGHSSRQETSPEVVSYNRGVAPTGILVGLIGSGVVDYSVEGPKRNIKR